MKIYISYGYTKFYIASGYKKKIIEKYFKNFERNGQEFHQILFKKKCSINILDTGKKTMTGGRLKRVSKYIKKNENFMFTYGDGLSNVNLLKLEKFHLMNKRIVTVTAVRPPARFGELTIKRKIVTKFLEKPQVSKGWINGGFFVLSPEVLSYISDDACIWEQEPLMNLAKEGELMAFEHEGFWQPMDTQRDHQLLNELFDDNKAPWVKW